MGGAFRVSAAARDWPAGRPAGSHRGAGVLRPAGRPGGTEAYGPAGPTGSAPSVRAAIQTGRRVGETAAGRAAVPDGNFLGKRTQAAGGEVAAAARRLRADPIGAGD